MQVIECMEPFHQLYQTSLDYFHYFIICKPIKLCHDGNMDVISNYVKDALFQDG